jgi:transcription initiation factor TFIID subunit 1
LRFFQILGEWQTEIIRDPAVIRAYVRARQVVEEEQTLADSLAPTGDADKDKRAKKRYFVSFAANVA